LTNKPEHIDFNVFERNRKSNISGEFASCRATKNCHLALSFKDGF
jgi:hypothetical protein